MDWSSGFSADQVTMNWNGIIIEPIEKKLRLCVQLSLVFPDILQDASNV